MKSTTLFLFIFSMVGLFSLSAQTISVVNRQSGKVVELQSRKIKSVVTLDGFFFEGRPQVQDKKLVFGEQTVPFSEIGILEVKKGSFRNVASFPFKLIGITTTISGILLSTSALNTDDDDNGATAAVAGLSLVGIGAGTTILGKKMSSPPSDTFRSFHTKDWKFE